MIKKFFTNYKKLFFAIIKKFSFDYTNTFFLTIFFYFFYFLFIYLFLSGHSIKWGASEEKKKVLTPKQRYYKNISAPGRYIKQNKECL